MTTFYWQFDCLHTILKKGRRKFEGNRPISKKVIAFQSLDAKPDLPFSKAGRKTQLQHSTTASRALFKDCLKLFQVFQVFHPLLSPIAPYPYLFTQWPHRLLWSTHVNTTWLTVASVPLRQCFCFHHTRFKKYCQMHTYILKTNTFFAKYNTLKQLNNPFYIVPWICVACPWYC